VLKADIHQPREEHLLFCVKPAGSGIKTAAARKPAAAGKGFFCGSVEK
jgi:hypothetical protein